MVFSHCSLDRQLDGSQHLTVFASSEARSLCTFSAPEYGLFPRSISGQAGTSVVGPSAAPATLYW